MNLELTPPKRFALKSLWSQEIRFPLWLFWLSQPNTLHSNSYIDSLPIRERSLDGALQMWKWAPPSGAAGTIQRRPWQNCTVQQFALSYKNRVLGSYGHGGARSVIPAGGPPRFIGTYILGNNIIRRRWNHVKTCFTKVHQKILHKHRIFYDSRYEFSTFFYK